MHRFTRRYKIYITNLYSHRTRMFASFTLVKDAIEEASKLQRLFKGIKGITIEVR